MERTDVRFRQREARAFSGWSDFQVKTHLRKLVDLEYVLARRDPEGMGLIYELVYDGAGKDGSRFLSGLLDIEKLRRTGNDGAQPDAAASASAGASPCGYDETREHRNGAREHGGSTAGGSREHGGSAGKTGASSSENASPSAPDAGNAHQEPGEENAAA
jgi:hypothetical protein